MWRGETASMRPRHKAAENYLARMSTPVRLRASMRPRHKAAENSSPGEPTTTGDRHASMRPRHKAAENGADDELCQRDDARFNEAAA